MGEDTYKLSDIKNFTKEFKRHIFLASIFIITVLILYTLGAVLFFYIEHCYAGSPAKLDLFTKQYFNVCDFVRDLHKHHNYGNHSTDVGNQSLLTSSDIGNPSFLMSSSAAIIEICEKNFKMKTASLKCNFDTNAFWKWFEYCAAVGYTIGYGNIVTKSSVGRIVTILFAVPTIGVTMALNLQLGNAFVDMTRVEIILFYTKILKRKVVRKMSLKVLWHQLFWLCCMCVSFGKFCQEVMFKRSKLNFTDSIYFSFVTFSSIGFGDILMEENSVAKMNVPELISGHLLMATGIAVVASALSGLSDLLAVRKSKKKKKESYLSRMSKSTNKHEVAPKLHAQKVKVIFSK